ncbi:hypothetical protein [Sphingomonas nostoxanthinifaciens]|uniref:hypothetical protein n=1 Tax=Sphingomonas nostoxanthinifaciens TaxID=2872652 RepID=UPI001CC20991|nr:hypothetical protein [Sphingomonas nostoxanthinifaciens]UAK24584.1 hypothetical protein K8P63_20175 [Sphingomonas nostoxanthinifaciens]
MISLLLTAALTLAEMPGGDEARFAACRTLIKSNPQRALDEADAWAKKTADVPAQQCLGLAFVGLERWEPAALTFATAAQDAEIKRDGRAALLWTQAGNAALGGDDPGKARQYLDRAVALPTLPAQLRGEAYLDRARADVALGDMVLGRIDLDKALALVPKDPFAWLLSATLARRESEFERAGKDIVEATRLAPDDPAVALEAGNIAAARGQADAALAAWSRAAQLGPKDPAGLAAAAALKANKQP